MLPPFIIDQIRKREEEEAPRPQPRVELPIPPQPLAEHGQDDDDRGVVVIDLM
ncbi:MAG: hypothetical protein JJ863_31600 [Deltaproteobacteria bacterium]|nr:hypothetical protein [Deltaproteobacteria bacterium]